MSLPVNDIVRVTAQIAEQGLIRREFGISLFLTTDTTLTGGAGRVQQFSNLDGVADIFAVGTEPYEAANVYFQQNPFPKNLVVGRWINTDIGAVLFGGSAASLAEYQAVSDGTLKIFFDGVETDIAGVDLSSATSLADVATAIQGAAGWPAAYPVSYNAIKGSFEIIGTTLGDGNTLSFASPEGTGTDLSGLLSWTSATGAKLQDGQNAETVEDALSAIAALNNQWYFVTLETTLWDTQTVLDVADWVAARPYMFFADSSDLGVLTTGETVSIFYQLAQLAQDRVAGTWSRTEDYKGLAAAAQLGAVNYAGSATALTLKFKTLSGTLADNISTTEKLELDSKNVNAYLVYSTIADQDAIYAEGTTFKDGVFADVRAFLDWFTDATQTEVYNLLRQSKKVPQTESGVATLQSAIDLVCSQAVTNGNIAPGQLSPALTADVQAATGIADFDGFLTKGYLIYTTPLADQSQSDRSQRKAPPTRIWLKGSGAFHFVDIEILLEN